ncbi:MAG: hypothetical protein EHM42_03650 [Planctomycetaceae bacterium]|nr:MAG: hypothetical protein EHM42_03650 [Planctomycetaceae bacterium]
MRRVLTRTVLQATAGLLITSAAWAQSVVPQMPAVPPAPAGAGYVDEVPGAEFSAPPAAPAMGMPGMGMPGMGVPGMGMPGMGMPGVPLMPGLPSSSMLSGTLGNVPLIGPLFSNPSGVTNLIPDLGPFRVSGWLDYGFVVNTSGPRSGFNGPYNSVDYNSLMFNQGYFILDAGLPEDGSWGLGARADILLGHDYLLAQSVGLELRPDGSSRWNSGEDFGIAIPQLYGVIGGEELQLKVGHFYTVVGYEGVPAVNNFFYSKAYSYQFAGPFTHWGGIATWNATGNLSFDVGLVNQWNTLDRSTDHLNVLTRAKYTSDNQDWWTSFAIISGSEFTNVAGLPGIASNYANRTRYSGIYSQSLGEECQWEYVFHHWLGFQDQGAVDNGTAWWYGIDQYLFYTMSEQWKVGGRFEWFRDQDGTRVGLNRPSNPNKPPFAGNFYSLSGGVNYTPYPNFIIRPELRYDWFDGTANPYDDGQKEHQFLLGIDMITRF